MVDWETIVKKIEDNPFTLVREVAASMAKWEMTVIVWVISVAFSLYDYLLVNICSLYQAEDELSKIDLVMHAMPDLRAEMLSSKAALEEIQQQIALGDVVSISPCRISTASN